MIRLNNTHIKKTNTTYASQAKGFAVVELLLVLLLATLIAGLGYYVYSQQNNDEDGSAATDTTQETTKRAEHGRVSFVLPDGYTSYDCQQDGLTGIVVIRSTDHQSVGNVCDGYEGSELTYFQFVCSEDEDLKRQFDITSADKKVTYAGKEFGVETNVFSSFDESSSIHRVGAYFENAGCVGGVSEFSSSRNGINEEFYKGLFPDFDSIMETFEYN